MRIFLTSQYQNAKTAIHPINKGIHRTPAIWARLILVLGIFIGTFSTPAHSQIEELEGILAIVDNDVVLLSDLNSRIQSIKSRLANSETKLPPDNVLKAQVLDHLILERLQLATAQRVGIDATDEEVNNAFTKLAQNNKVSPDQMMSAMLQSGQSASRIFRDIHQELVLQKVQRALVNQRIFVSESEIDTFLNSAEGKFWSAPTLNLQHILIPLSGNASPDDVVSATTLSSSVYEQLQKGADFGALAVQFSSGPSALQGGGLGWRRAIEFQPALAEVLKDAQVGVPTAPTRAAGGIHIFLTLDVRGGNKEELVQQTETRHILLSPNTIRSDEETKQLANELRNRAINGEDFSDLAREFSEDISNAMNGGYLDWVLPGSMVPPFEQAMNATPVGAVSEPVQTRFGWHVLLVEGRRDVDMSNEILRNQARSVLRSQRFEEELDLWQREIRSDAFVSIRER